MIKFYSEYFSKFHNRLFSNVFVDKNENIFTENFYGKKGTLENCYYCIDCEFCKDSIFLENQRWVIGYKEEK